MPFSVFFNTENNLIEGIFSGEVDQSILREYATKCAELIEKEKCQRVFSDYRQADFSFSIIDLYRIPERHSDLFLALGSNVFVIKRAGLFSKKYAELANFFEDVAVNRGQNFKSFFDKSAALDWLLIK